MRTDLMKGKLGFAAGTAAAMLIAAPTALAQEEVGEAPMTIDDKLVSVAFSVDWVSEYWFRGLAQENQGIIVQPGLDLAFDVPIGDFSITPYVGIWNSFHFDNPSGTDGGDNDNAWYEADLYAGVGFGVGDFGFDVSYINLYNPAGGGEFAEEIDLGISYDDSDLWGDGGFYLSPYATLAFEIDGGSDNGSNKGTYLELGVAPGFDTGSDSLPISISVPVTVGLSLDDYYENAAGEDETFGFAQVGVEATTALPIPAELGGWSVTGGVYYIILGDTADDIASEFGVTSDDSSVWFKLGVAMEF